jgi:hypothetical protein
VSLRKQPCEQATLNAVEPGEAEDSTGAAEAADARCCAASAVTAVTTVTDQLCVAAGSAGTADRADTQSAGPPGAAVAIDPSWLNLVFKFGRRFE